MTKIIKTVKFRVSAICLAGAISATQTAWAQPQKIDLRAAINIALENNETYGIARKELDKANAQVTEAVSGALPKITGGLTYLRNWVVPTGVFQMNEETITFKFGTDNSYTAYLTLTQPIYSGGRTFTALKIAHTYKKMSKETVRSARQDLKLSVFNSFYGAVLAGEIHRVNSESYDLARQNLDVVQKMFDQGMAAEYDLLRARVAVANLEPDVIKSQSDKEVALSALKNVMGVDLDTEVEIEVDFDSSQFIMPPLDSAEAVTELKENRPEVKIMDYQTRLRGNLVSISKADYRPVISFSSSLQYQSQFNSGSVFDKKWDRSLNSIVTLTVPIFDSWRTPSRVKQARVELAQSRLQEQSVVKSMILDYEQSLGKFTEARKRLSAQGDAVELARRGLEIASVRYENGVGTQLEVSDARLSLARAEINRAMAFHDLAISYAALLRALGREIEPAS